MCAVLLAASGKDPQPDTDQNDDYNNKFSFFVACEEIEHTKNKYFKNYNSFFQLWLEGILLSNNNNNDCSISRNSTHKYSCKTYLECMSLLGFVYDFP